MATEQQVELASIHLQIERNTNLLVERTSLLEKTLARKENPQFGSDLDFTLDTLVRERRLRLVIGGREALLQSLNEALSEPFMIDLGDGRVVGTSFERRANILQVLSESRTDGPVSARAILERLGLPYSRVNHQELIDDMEALTPKLPPVGFQLVSSIDKTVEDKGERETFLIKLSGVEQSAGEQEVLQTPLTDEQSPEQSTPKLDEFWYRASVSLFMFRNNIKLDELEDIERQVLRILIIHRGEQTLSGRLAEEVRRRVGHSNFRIGEIFRRLAEKINGEDRQLLIRGGTGRGIWYEILNSPSEVVVAVAEPPKAKEDSLEEHLNLAISAFIESPEELKIGELRDLLEIKEGEDINIVLQMVGAVKLIINRANLGLSSSQERELLRKINSKLGYPKDLAVEFEGLLTKWYEVQRPKVSTNSVKTDTDGYKPRRIETEVSDIRGVLRGLIGVVRSRVEKGRVEFRDLTMLFPEHISQDALSYGLRKNIFHPKSRSRDGVKEVPVAEVVALIFAKMGIVGIDDRRLSDIRAIIDQELKV